MKVSSNLMHGGIPRPWKGNQSKRIFGFWSVSLQMRRLKSNRDDDEVSQKPFSASSVYRVRQNEIWRAWPLLKRILKVNGNYFSFEGSIGVTVSSSKVVFGSRTLSNTISG